MKVLYIYLYVAMVMVAYTLANPVKTRSSSGADQNLEEEYLVPVKPEDKFVKVCSIFVHFTLGKHAGLHQMYSPITFTLIAT